MTVLPVCTIGHWSYVRVQCALLFSALAKGFGFLSAGFGHWPYILQYGMKKGKVFARSVVLNDTGRMCQLFVTNRLAMNKKTT